MVRSATTPILKYIYSIESRTMEESVEEVVAGLFTRLEGQVKKHQSKRAIKTCDESASSD